MINSTLGGLIKDYRIQKGISQLDIAFALGWKETSRLSRIEQGKTEKPPRKLIDQIIQAIGLEEEEKNVLLLTGSYIPTEEEIIKVRKETDPLIADLPHPASVLDFSWRAISHNKYLAELYSLTPQEELKIETIHPRILEIVFEDVGKQSKKQDSLDLSIMRKFLKDVVLNFKYEQRYRTKERWYMDHVKKLMDNEIFRQIWVETDIRNKLDGVIGKHTVKSFVCPEDKNKLLNFYLFIVPVLKDQRFEIEMLIPKDLETYKYYQKKLN